MSASIERHSRGFVVVCDGRRMPKMLPGHLLTFASRYHARRFAAALDRGDLGACHDLIAAHGREWVTQVDAGAS